MDAQSVINILGTVLCIAAMAIPALVVITYGIRSRMAYATRIQELIRAGAYESWGKPPMSGRLSLIGALGLMALCGLMVWIGLFLTERAIAFSAPALATAGVLFLGMLVAGITLQ